MSRKNKTEAVSALRRRRARNGAALMFALAAILIIMTVVAGMLVLVDGHIDLEETTRSYSRAINIAEAAANWQLNRMSRTLPAGNPGGIPGYMTYDTFNATNQYGSMDAPLPLPQDQYSGNNSLAIPGSVVTWTTNNANNTWVPPGGFKLYAIGYDPDALALGRRVAREVRLDGTATSLSDRYVLFGNASLQFKSHPNNPAKTWNINPSYIGTNGNLVIDHQYPNSNINPPISLRLGPNAAVSPIGIGGWPSNWDVVRLPDTVYWPSVQDVTQYVYQGSLPNQLSNVNNNNQIWYRDQDGNWQRFATTPTKLTAAEFSQSVISAKNPYRTICLSVSPTSSNGNLFYFTDIKMNPTDVLVLDVGPPPGSAGADGSDIPQTLRILLDGTPGHPMVVTNLAYCNYKAVHKPSGATIVWFNNTNAHLQFSPNVDTTQIYTYPAVGIPDYDFSIRPIIKGLVYGGDIDVQGGPVPVTVNCVVGENVLIDASKGPITVTRPANNVVETDNFMYVLYYRVTRNYEETLPGQTAGFPLVPPNYGKFTP